jgi:hypothetical protein
MAQELDALKSPYAPEYDDRVRVRDSLEAPDHQTPGEQNNRNATHNHKHNKFRVAEMQSCIHAEMQTCNAELQ